jgi:uncharacterized protein (TIGR03086 family)
VIRRKTAAMTTTQIPDPRPLHRRALVWVPSLVAGVGAEQLDRPTPCAEFDVRALLGHLAATVDRARVIGEGGEVFSVPHVVTDVPDDGWQAAFAARIEKMSAIWADDSLLDREMSAPWGAVPGRAAVWGYLNETLVHGWDLAVATGQDAEADPELAGAVLAVCAQIIPAQHRGGQVPFAAVVEPAAGAGPTERVANWSGHRRP